MIEQIWYDDEQKVPVKIWTDDINQSAKQQMLDTAKLPFIHKWISLMPDVHMAIGCSVGSVIPTHKAIIPAAVGVDIGCGMMAAKTNLTANDLPDNLYDIRHSIEREIPIGPGGQYQDHGFVRRYPTTVEIDKEVDDLWDDFIFQIEDLSEHISNKEWMRQLGTLGSGNHFIEICLDENQNVWIMLHSGSRGIGNMIGRHFIAQAKKEMEIYYINVPNKDLAYIPEGTEHFEQYVTAVDWAQKYASLNRRLMMNGILYNLQHYFPHVGIDESMIKCHHN